MRMECLPGSTLPDELRNKGYTVTEIGEGMRILPAAIVTLTVVEGSSVPIPVTHAGIVRVQRYGFAL
jgi:hypothetical protein